MKQAVGFGVLAVLGWLLYALFGPTQNAAAQRTFTSSKDCQECHAEVYAEWADSWHARSWIDEDVRAQSKNFSNTDCIDCHAPRPVFETGVGNRVLPRATRRNEGVDCIACHMLPEGGVAGTITNGSAACRPIQKVELQRVDFCAGCHDQHKTVRQWKETIFAEQGIGCIDCHMPYRNGDEDSGRSHLCLGGHDMELVRSAVELRGAPHASGSGWTVEVENVAAGHSYPTDERSRASDLFWRPLASGVAAATGEDPGEQPWRFLYRIRDPYRYEVDIPSTLIMHGETRKIDLTDADGHAGVEVMLVYKLTPFYRDPETGEPLETETVTDPLSDSKAVHTIVLKP